jgi:hypothetical protein
MTIILVPLKVIITDIPTKESMCMEIILMDMTTIISMELMIMVVMGIVPIMGMALTNIKVTISLSPYLYRNLQGEI